MVRMRRTVWTLLMAWLLQLLLASSGWALASAAHAHTTANAVAAPACHGIGVSGLPQAPAAARASAHDAHATHSAPAHHSGNSTNSTTHHSADSHHCCAVGLGLGLAPMLAPLPQAAPVGVALRWASLSTRPDLRPPI